MENPPIPLLINRAREATRNPDFLGFNRVGKYLGIGNHPNRNRIKVDIMRAWKNNSRNSRVSRATAFGRSRTFRKFKKYSKRKGFGKKSRKFLKKFKRRGKKSGVISTVMKKLFPLRRQVGTCTWGMSVSQNTVFYTSMEVGNYAGTAYTAGMGPQSTFLAKPGFLSHNNGGSFDPVINDGSFGTNQKRFLYPQKCRITMQNNSNSQANIKVYHCALRNSEGTGGAMTFYQRFQTALGADGISLQPHNTPFDSYAFTSQTKILKSTSFRLGPGEHRTITIKSPIYGNKSFNQLTDEPCSAKWFRGALILAHGFPAHDQTNDANVGIAGCRLDFTATTYTSYRLTNSTTQSLTSNLYNASTMSTVHFDPGNANDPTIYTQ